MILAMLMLCPCGRAAAQPLDERSVVAHAIADNPDLRAAVLDVHAARAAVRAAEAEHLPTLRVGFDGGHNEAFGSTLEGITPNSDDQVGLDIGVSYGARWGGEVSLELGGAWRTREVNRDPSTTSALAIGPSYGVDARLDLRQPLLRGFGRDVGEASIRAARLSRTADEHARDRTASELLRDVLRAYWELWYATAAVEVQRTAQELGQRQLAEAEARVDQLGTVARTEVLRFASELASIEEALAVAEATRLSRALELGRLLGRPPVEAGPLEVAAAEPGPVASVDLEDVVARASREASELRELAAEVELARDQVRAARDATLPRLDLTGSLAVGALWDDESLGTGELPGDRPAISGLVGMELELPLGNAAAQATLAEVRLRADAAQVRLEARRRALETEAAILVSDLVTTDRRVELARRSVELAAQLAEAERERLRLGTTTALSVLEAQANHRDTELRYLRALSDRTSAALSLQHLTGELLARFSELIEEP